MPHEDTSAIQLELAPITTTVRGRAIEQLDHTDPMHGKEIEAVYAAEHEWGEGAEASGLREHSILDCASGDDDQADNGDHGSGCGSEENWDDYQQFSVTDYANEAEASANEDLKSHVESGPDIEPPRLEALRNPVARPWALGWLADREYFIELGRVLNLCQGSAAEDIIKLEAAAIHYVTSKTWWPNLVECIVDGSSEHVFAVYVDYKRRLYPPSSIPRSELIPRKYCDRLDVYMPLDDDPQWFTCINGSYTPWRYAYQEPGPKAIWMDVSRYAPHPDADYDRIEVAEEEEELGEYYEEEDPEAVLDDDTQEDASDEGYCTDEGENSGGEDEHFGLTLEPDSINANAPLN